MELEQTVINTEIQKRYIRMLSSEAYEFLEHVSITKQDGVFVINIDAPIAITSPDNIIINGKNILVLTKGITQIESEYIHLNSLEKHKQVRLAIIENITSIGQKFIQTVSKARSLINAKQLVNSFLETHFSRTLSVKAVLKKETFKVTENDDSISK